MRPPIGCLLLLALPPAAAADPAPGWDVGWQARVTVAHDRFSGLHADPGAGATWLRRAEVGGRVARGPWRGALAVQRAGDGRWSVDEWQLAWRNEREAASGWAWTAGRFDPAFGLAPTSGTGAQLAPEASPVWDALPEVDDSEGAEVVAVHRWHGAWALQASGLHRPTRAPQWQARLSHGRADRLAGVSLAWQGDAADDGRLRSRLGVRGASEHPRGRRLTLVPRADVTDERAWGLDGTVLQGPWLVSVEVVGRHVHGADAHRAQGATALLAWSSPAAARRIDVAQGRLRAPRPAVDPAWTLYARSGWLAAEPGGQLRELLGGLELRWHSGLRLQLAVAQVRARAHDAPASDTGRSFSLRWEWSR